jgi:hypothetical protein
MTDSFYEAAKPIKNSRGSGGAIRPRSLSEEDMMKISPAAVLAQRLMQGKSNIEEVEKVVAGLRQDHPEVEITTDFGQPDDFRPNAEYPDRPDHQDFRDLARIVSDMDATAEAQGWEHVFIPMGVDGESLAYVVKQRVARAQQLLTDDGTTEWDRMGILWIDAFTTAVKWMREKQPFVRTVLDDSINGSHRTGGLQ